LLKIDYLLKEVYSDFQDHIKSVNNFKIILLSNSIDESDWWGTYFIKRFKLNTESFKITPHIDEIVPSPNLIIVGNSLLNNENFIKEIELFRKNNNYAFSQTPMIALLEKSTECDMQYLYDIGFDYCIIKKSLFLNEGRSPNKENVYKLILSILYYVVKSEILIWFWEHSITTKENMKKQLEKFPENKVIDSQNIQKRIFDKLKVAIGHLRKPKTSFEEYFNLTNEVFAFLTYWSCFNEISFDWIKYNKNSGEKKLKTGLDISRVEAKKEYSKIISEYEIPVQFIEPLKKRFPHKYKNIQKPVKSYNRSVSQIENELKSTQYQSFQLPTILALNDVSNDPRLVDLIIINEVRNTIAYNHSLPYSADNLSLQDDIELKQIYFDCLTVFKFLYFMLNNWIELAEKEIDFAKRKIYKLNYINGKIKGENNLRAEGIFLGEKRKVDKFIHFYVKLIKYNQKLKFQILGDNASMLNDFTKNDNVEIFFHLTPFYKQPNSSEISDIMATNLEVDAIFKI
jgi:hypothetical protein